MTMTFTSGCTVEMKSAEAGPVRPSGVLAHASQREAVTSESGERRDDTVVLQ